MSNKIECAGLQIDSELYHLLVDEISPGTGINPDYFWQGVGRIWAELGAENALLLEKRASLQSQIDAWHLSNTDNAWDASAYQQFLTKIGYLLPQPAPFQITTTNVDPEITTIAGPQLVVPVMNARYALNAANARWGSLYDALYGTDAIPEEQGAERRPVYNPVRGDKVIAWARKFLDSFFPLTEGNHQSSCKYVVEAGSLTVRQINGINGKLERNSQFIGYKGSKSSPDTILLKHHGLHVEIQIDRTDSVGTNDPAGIKDIYLESAITSIQDCEDSVAAVDAADKVLVYRNWLGLMKGDLTDTFYKDGKTVTRRLNPDRLFYSPDGKKRTLPGRSLMFVRNVGHLMTSNAILDAKGNEIPEGFMDGLFTTFCALHDIKKTDGQSNSRCKSVYIVKPKMHGPEEVTFAIKLFSRIESLFHLPQNTLKIGIMDEERRTTLNLAECIKRASERVVFINTGFLDRTADEIHTNMEAGAVPCKNALKEEIWIKAYEKWNVDTGLACGFLGKAQIGKGMWAMPDLMAEMLKIKKGHPEAGANCAWVPSPTAATLHATHYHEVLVCDVQKSLLGKNRENLNNLLVIPLNNWTKGNPAIIQEELDNNVQGILGYVVRWVEHGIGCSKVPDIHNVGLMEDRATLRISSQHIANWLRHGVVSENQVRESLDRMAKIVDAQNGGDPEYQKMSDRREHSQAFLAASELIFAGAEQPNGYTEPVLNKHRLIFKEQKG